jgi:argonaute-like protein implicated in RNA metabolism and viral defense
MVGFDNKGEKNEQLKRELAELACGPYNCATKEVASITKQLINSQKMVQNVSATLRKVSNELFSLEESIHSIKNNKNFLINDFVTKSDPSKNTSSDTQVLPDSLYSSTSHQN